MTACPPYAHVLSLTALGGGVLTGAGTRTGMRPLVCPCALVHEAGPRLDALGHVPVVRDDRVASQARNRCFGPPNGPVDLRTAPGTRYPTSAPPSARGVTDTPAPGASISATGIRTGDLQFRRQVHDG